MNTKTLLEGTMTHIPVRRILESEEIPYRPLDKEHVIGLFKNIKDNCLDQPLVVWNGGGSKGKIVELEGSGKQVAASFLVAGRHRLSAIKKLFKTDVARYKELFPEGVPVIVRGGELNDALAAQLRENVQKRDMAMEDVFPIIQVMRDKYKMKQKAIARAIGKSDAWVSQVFDIEESLGAEAAEEIKKGGLKLSHARKVAKKVKDAKKQGKAVSAKEELSKMRERSKALKAKGLKREVRRLSPGKVWERFQGLSPKTTTGKKLLIATAALGYLANDEEYDSLPEELTPPDTEEKKSKKSKK